MDRLRQFSDQTDYTIDPQTLYEPRFTDRKEPTPALWESFGAAFRNSAEYGIVQGFVEDKAQQSGLSSWLGNNLPWLEEHKTYSGYNGYVRDRYGIKTREDYLKYKFTAKDLKTEFGLDERLVPTWATEGLTGGQIDTILAREEQRAINSQIADTAWNRGGFLDQFAVGSGEFIGGSLVDTLTITAATAGLGTAGAALANSTKIGQALVGTKAVAGASKVYNKLYGPQNTLIKNMGVAAAENAIFEAASLPLQSESNRNRALQFTEAQQFDQVVLAGAAGGLLGGTLKTLADKYRSDGVPRTMQYSKIQKSVAGEILNQRLQGRDPNPETILRDIAERAPREEELARALSVPEDLRTEADIEVIQRATDILAGPYAEVLQAPSGEKAITATNNLTKAVESAKALTEETADGADTPIVLPRPDKELLPGTLEPIRTPSGDIEITSDIDLALYRYGDELTPEQRRAVDDLLMEDSDLTPEQVARLAEKVKEKIDAEIGQGNVVIRELFQEAASEVLPPPKRPLDLLPEVTREAAKDNLDNTIQIIADSLPGSPLKEGLERVLRAGDLREKVIVLRELEEQGLLPSEKKITEADQAAYTEKKAEYDAALKKYRQAVANAKKVATMNAQRRAAGEPEFSTTKTDAALEKAEADYNKLKQELEDLETRLGSTPDGPPTAERLNLLGARLLEETQLTDEQVAKNAFREVFRSIGSLKKLYRTTELRNPLTDDHPSATYRETIKRMREQEPQLTSGEFIIREAEVLERKLELMDRSVYGQDPEVQALVTKYSDDARTELTKLKERTQALDSAMPEAVECLIENGLGVGP